MSDINLIIKATDNASAVLNRINKNVDKLDKNGKRASKAMGGMGAALKTVAVAAAAIGLGKLVSSTVQTIAKFESLRASLKTVTGSVDGARVAFARIQEFTAKTPFQLDEVTDSFIILQRYGIDTSIKSLNAFGNIAAANGKSFNQLAEAVGDALTGEFERLKEFGIKVQRENDKFVMSMGETQLAVTDSAGDLVNELKKLGEEGGRYASGLADQSATLGGKFSNLKDNISQFAASIGEGGLNTALKDVLDSFNSLGGDAPKVGRLIGAGLGAAIITIMNQFGKLKEIVTAVFSGIVELGNDLLISIKRNFTYFKDILGRPFADFLEEFGDVFNEAGRMAKVGVNFIINLFRAFIKQSAKIINNLPEIFFKIFDGIQNLTTDFGGRLIGQFKNIGEGVGQALSDPFNMENLKDSLAIATKNAFAGFKFSDNFKLPEETFLTQEDYNQIFGFDAMGAAIDFLKTKNRELIKEMGLTTVTLDGLKPGAAFTGFMEEFNRLLQEGKDEQLALEEALKKTTTAQDNNSNSTKGNNKELSDREKFLKKVNKSYDDLIAKITKTTEADKINAELLPRINEAYEAGTINLQQYSDALTDIGSKHEPLAVKALRTANTIKDGFRNMAGQVTDVFFNMFTGVTSAFEGLKSIARMVFEMVAKAVIQAFIVRPLLGMMGIPMFANGGVIPSGQPAIVGERGPEIITGQAGGTRVYSNTESRNMMNSGASDGEAPVNINFNINAIDTQSGTEFLLENEGVITGFVQEAFNRRGRPGPLG